MNDNDALDERELDDDKQRELWWRMGFCSQCGECPCTCEDRPNDDDDDDA